MAGIVIEKAQVQPRNVSMYPQDWAVVRQMAKDMGLASISAGLRQIVQEWKRLKGMQEAMEQYLRLENAVRMEIITQDEFMSALGLVTIMIKRGGNGGHRNSG